MRSKVSEQFLGAFMPANSGRSEPKEGNSPGSKNMEKQALELIQGAKDRLGRPITISYGRQRWGRGGHTWRITSGEFNAEHEDFLKATGSFLAKVYNIKNYSDEID